jgi:hypothetical protein
MSVTGFEVSELKEIIATLKAAYTRAIASGGVTSYTISSGQGSTTVQQASLNSIKEQLAYWQQLLNEELEYGTGSHCTFIRDAGVL